MKNDLEKDILEHIGKRLQELNSETPDISRLKRENNNSAREELLMILKIFQNHQESET
ncbi:hypothetical protein [Clostridium estertheticum]|uniref:hypothetical protein n=1 Tax=Clostridium estertheticum TaxID=238834 RepID=UPI001C7DC046|nr:hypothetical protein [Clostridium estertheticum]MBX4264428.1 hypothetical protein [Clostridium estertheticum]MBX4267178.1 hypothetical protein [Clostridium estertheticum]WLC89271.1 hypothetical protein KTC95_03310 [Clostridium estertheticum]WLC91301.1 hypothetical protein KTC95_24155 [Clostridium estertheticum]